MSFKVLYLNESGDPGRLPDLATVNIGGTMGPTFHVGGRPLLFADGGATDGSSAANLSLTMQDAYDNSTPSEINLTANKHFRLNALNNAYFSINADTGKVTVSGDLDVLGNLEVFGSTEIVEGTLSNIDQIIITPPGPTVSALIIEPMPLVNMTSDLVSVKVLNGGPAVLRIAANGSVFIGGVNFADVLSHLQPSGTRHSASQISVSALANLAGTTVQEVLESTNAVAAHIQPGGTRHSASQISVVGPLINAAGDDVQEILQSIDTVLTSLANTITTYEHIQVVPTQTWTVSHGASSLRPIVTIYDTSNRQILANEVQILDANTVQVLFSDDTSGRALLILL